MQSYVFVGTWNFGLPQITFPEPFLLPQSRSQLLPSGSLSFLHDMLAARVSSARRATRIARGFASVVDTAGLKVASVDNGQPTSAVTFLVKAGSRYESKAGLAHALKNYAFKVRLGTVCG